MTSEKFLHHGTSTNATVISAKSIPGGRTVTRSFCSCRIETKRMQRLLLLSLERGGARADRAQPAFSTIRTFSARSFSGRSFSSSSYTPSQHCLFRISIPHAPKLRQQNLSKRPSSRFYGSKVKMPVDTEITRNLDVKNKKYSESFSPENSALLTEPKKRYAIGESLLNSEP